MGRRNKLKQVQKKRAGGVDQPLSSHSGDNREGMPLLSVFGCLPNLTRKKEIEEKGFVALRVHRRICDHKLEEGGFSSPWMSSEWWPFLTAHVPTSRAI